MNKYQKDKNNQMECCIDKFTGIAGYNYQDNKDD